MTIEERKALIESDEFQAAYAKFLLLDKNIQEEIINIVLEARDRHREQKTVEASQWFYSKSSEFQQFVMERWEELYLAKEDKMELFLDFLSGMDEEEIFESLDIED